MMNSVLQKLPCRLIIAIMIFTCNCVGYMMRVNLSVNLVAMLAVDNHTHSNSQVALNWTAFERAQVLSGFFWGYMFGCMVGGPITDVLGPRILLSSVVLTCSILTHLSPLAAKHSYITLLIIRILLGLVSGIIFPGLHVLISKWAVNAERGRFIGVLISGAIGTFFAWTICGFIIEPMGWEWGFHIFGIIGLVWVVVYWFVVYDTPEKHPRISPSELQYINQGITDFQTTKLAPPYVKIFTSIPFWSLGIASFGNGWGIYFVVTAAPNYLATALGYGTSASGFLSALIYLVRSSCSFGFGYLGDVMSKRNLMRVNVLRKVACICSHVIPGLIVLCMAIPNHDPIFYVTLIVIAMGLNGFVTVSSIANAHDLTKDHIGTITGITGMLATAAGIISPFVTAYFTENDETNPMLWRPVFYTGGFVYIISGLQFVIFGSTKKQSWDQNHEKGFGNEDQVEK